MEVKKIKHMKMQLFIYVFIYASAYFVNSPPDRIGFPGRLFQK